MKQIAKDDFNQLAELAALELNAEDAANLQQDISQILGYVEQLDQLDVSGVEPTYYGAAQQNVWRDDTVQSSLAPEILLALSPDVDSNQIKVPKVL